MHPRNDKGLKRLVDTDFSGGWLTNKYDDPASVYYHTEYIIKYKNCPIMWASKITIQNISVQNRNSINYPVTGN